MSDKRFLNITFCRQCQHFEREYHPITSKVLDHYGYCSKARTHVSDGKDIPEACPYALEQTLMKDFFS